jgi:hypothetical protein
MKQTTDLEKSQEELAKSIKRGTRGTYSGYPAIFKEHYYGGMINIFVPGGETCVGINEFVIENSK